MPFESLEAQDFRMLRNTVAHNGDYAAEGHGRLIPQYRPCSRIDRDDDEWVGLWSAQLNIEAWRTAIDDPRSTLETKRNALQRVMIDRAQLRGEQ
jgi:hypothetical protein